MSRSFRGELGWTVFLAVFLVAMLCRPALAGVSGDNHGGGQDIPVMNGDQPPGGGDSGDPDEFGIYAAPITPSHDSITRHPMPKTQGPQQDKSADTPIQAWKLFLMQFCFRGF